MATAAFKSTTRRPNSSSSSSSASSLKEPPKNTTSSNKPPPRRSRSVSAVPRSDHDTSSLSSLSDFLIKRDNPLYWSNVSPPDKEISENFAAETKSFNADDSRGRSVSRNFDARSDVSDKRKDFSRILPKVDNGRRRSVSRGPVGRTRPLNSQSDAEGVNLLTRHRNGSDSDGGSSVSRKSYSDRSYSHRTPDQVKSFPVSPRGSSINLLSNSCGDKALGSSFPEADKRSVQRKYLQEYGLEDDASSCIYETVRSEVRRAIADIQNDLESAIIRSSASTVTNANIVDLSPDLVNPGAAVELVLDIRREYSRKLEQSQEHARKLRAELEVEEHRGLELSRILKEVLPHPKTSDMRRSRLGRKSSIERRKISKRLTDEAIAYFDECISLSTFDSSDFDSQDEPPISIVGNSAPIGDYTSPYEASTSLAGAQGLNSSPKYKQEWDSTCDNMSQTSATRSERQTSDETGADNLETRGHPMLRFSLARNQSETLEFQHQIGEYVKKVEIVPVKSQNLRSKSWDLEEYNFQASSDGFLFDTLIFKNKIESGTILLCGGVTISLSPFAYVN